MAVAPRVLHVDAVSGRAVPRHAVVIRQPREPFCVEIHTLQQETKTSRQLITVAGGQDDFVGGHHCVGLVETITHVQVVTVFVATHQMHLAVRQDGVRRGVMIKKIGIVEELRQGLQSDGRHPVSGQLVRLNDRPFARLRQAVELAHIIGREIFVGESGLV